MSGVLDWLIVGGGVHGTHASHRLTHAGVARDRLRVLDPHDEPLARWHARAHNTGMSFLRSPSAHNLDVRPADLRQFAETDAPDAHYARPYHRPATALFRRHVDALLEHNDLRTLRLRGEAVRLRCEHAHVRVETDRGVLLSRRVVLALGAGDAPLWPAWARALRARLPVVDHVFDPGFTRPNAPPWRHVAVIGGGITAAQTAVALGRLRPGSVTLLSRHAPRVEQFDSDICWIGERCLRGFLRSDDPDFRREVIRRARHRGSMPPDVFKQLHNAARRGQVHIQRGEVVRWDPDPLGPGVLLHIGGTSVPLAVDRVLLATGFDPARPGGSLVADAIDAHGLRCAACGYPVVDTLLRWHPRLHVMGPLADLEIGPVSRNIIGARLAATRLVDTHLSS